MTAQFHEGDEVEVQCLECKGALLWRKANIVRVARITSEKIEYEVQFTDGPRAVFDVEYIREVPNRDLAKMTSDELQEDVNDCYGGAATSFGSR